METFYQGNKTTIYNVNVYKQLLHAFAVLTISEKGLW